MKSVTEHPDVQRLVAQVVKLQAEVEKHRWIPVSERLPEETNRGYLIYMQRICPCIATFDGETFFDAFTKYSIKNITHWKLIILPDQALEEQQ